MSLQCCSSSHVRLIWDMILPSCLQKQEHGEIVAGGAAVRQLTLEDILYPPASCEMDAIGGSATPAPGNSPKVSPVKLDFSSEIDSPIVDESITISRNSLRSHSSMARRVSFRSPDDSDVFIIPARTDSDDDDDDSSDSETCRI